MTVDRIAPALVQPRRLASGADTAAIATMLDRGLDTPAKISHRAPPSEASAVVAGIAGQRLVHRTIVFDPTA